MKYNFNKINTLNQGTSYDYNSVMQYERLVASNSKQTIRLCVLNGMNLIPLHVCSQVYIVLKTV